MLSKFFFFYGYVVPNMNMSMSLYQGRFLPNPSPVTIGYCMLDPICEQYGIHQTKQQFLKETQCFDDLVDEFSRAYRLVTQGDFGQLCQQYLPEHRV